MFYSELNSIVASYRLSPWQQRLLFQQADTMAVWHSRRSLNHSFIKRLRHNQSSHNNVSLLSYSDAKQNNDRLSLRDSRLCPFQRFIPELCAI